MNDEKTISVQQELLNAMYTIAKGVVAQQSFDVTKDCKIIEAYTDNKGVKTGVYKVKTQDAIFDAFAQQNAEYFVDQIVHVQILNGDYDNDKFIIGLKADHDNTSSIYNLKMPFDDFLGLYNLTQYNPMIEKRAYWANCPEHGDDTTEVAEEENGIIFPKSEDHVWHWENIENTKIYATKLGLEVDVTTLLHGFNLISGHYGLRIIVNGEIKGVNNEPNSYGYRTYNFLDTSMYGNPYAYTAPSTQQIVIDISEFLRITSIDVWFTQDHDFRNESGDLISYGATNYDALFQDYQNRVEEILNTPNMTETEKELAQNEALQNFSTQLNNASDVYNIIFENLHCFLGMTAEELKEEEVILYTYEAMSYGIDHEDERIRDIDRQLHLAWAHADSNGITMIDSYEQLEELKADIYWYKYDKTWAPEHEEYDIENISHKLGGNYWRPIEITDTQSGNIGLTVIPDRNMNKQRYKAIIRHEGSLYASNVLVFTNTTTPETDRENLARNDKIILRCSILAEDQDGYTTLLPDDAIGNFFVYNENNHVLANDDNVLFSNVRYFIEPWIRPGSGDIDETDPKYGYQRLADYMDEDGKYYNFNVTWQFPESFTMIRSWGLLDDSAKNEAYWNNRSDILFERDKNATRYFYIEELHNIRYNDNEISAIISIEGMGEFTAKKELQFGRAGAFGCEFTPVIFISEPAGNYYVDTEAPFELYCLVYDRQGRLLPEEDRLQCKFKWKYYGTVNKPIDNGIYENYEGFLSNVIRGRIKTPDPFVVEVTVSGAAEYDIVVRRGIMVSNNAQFMHDHDIICPDRVEFRSDGQTPFYASNTFEVQKIIIGEGIAENGTRYSYQNELIYPTWQINNEKVLQLIARDMDYPEFTLPDGTAQSRTRATTYGLEFSANKLNTNVAQSNDIGQQWTEDLLNDDYFTYIYFEYNGVVVAQAIAFAQNLYPSSLVNEWDGQSLALDEENGAIIAKMIAAGTKDQRNRFTGVMMGNWSEKGDESLDTPGLYGFNAGQQSFGLKTDGTGFIGPSGEGRIQFDGRNALISNSSKTCYINLNPRRISNYIEPAEEGGYVINNQAWDAINNQSISQYFLYTQTPRRISTFANNDNAENTATESPWWVSDWTQHQEKRWVDKFLNDSDHDYFIVDPSYGVMTTGGIFARYGQLGHKYPWVISDYGLTQKNNFGRIFLGNPEKNLSLGWNIPTPTFTKKLDDGTWKEITVDSNFFSASFANVNNIIQTGIRADGYLYTKFASIGGWYVNDNEIYSVDSATYERDDTNRGFRKSYSDDGYKKDLLNINSKNQFIAFNNGRFIINGKDGWMGFYSHQNEDENGNITYDTIELTKSPLAYNMWINFENGTINFGKASTDPIPHVQINGKTGNAYFAKGNIVIDGENATIFCGVPTNPHNPYITNTKGTIQLANIAIDALTVGLESYWDPKNNPPPYELLSNTYSTFSRENETTGEADTDIEKFSQIWGNGVAGFVETTDTTYVPGKQYYKTESLNDKFIPEFSTSLSVKPSSVTISDYTPLLAQMSLTSPTTTGTTTLTISRYVIYKENEESSSIESNLSSWQIHNTDISLEDYNIIIPESEQDSLLTIVIEAIVEVSNWTIGLYEYNESIDDLQPMQKLGLLNVNQTTTSTPLTIMGSGKLDFTQNSSGMCLFLDAQDTTTASKAVLMPTGVGTGVLYNWNIDAKNIYVQDSVTIANILTVETAMMKEPLAIPGSGYGILATQLWVDNYIVNKVWPQIKTVNNAAAKAMKKAKDAWSRAGKAIEKAESNLAKIEQAQKDIEDTALVTFSWEMGDGRNDFHLGTKAAPNKYHWFGATATHGHVLTPTFTNGKLKLHIKNGSSVTSPDNTELADLSAAVKDLSGNSTTGELSWTTYGGTDGNFNIADTDYFKKRAVSAVKMEMAGSGTSAYVYAYDMNNEKINSKYTTCALSLNSIDKKVNLFWSGNIVASYDLSDYYTAAYNAGWNDCRDAMTAYTFTAEGQKTLYSKSGEEYTSEGYYYWYRRSSGISSTTLYTRPSKK